MLSLTKSRGGIAFKVNFSHGAEGNRSADRTRKPDEILRLFNVLFADDYKIFASTSSALQEMLKVFDEVVRYFGQEVAVEKSKIIIGDDSYENTETNRCKRKRSSTQVKCGPVLPQTTVPKASPTNFNILGKPLEIVSKFKVLGMLQSRDGRIDTEIKERMSKMAFSFQIQD